MACFIVSAAEAAIVTAVEKNIEKKEAQELSLNGGHETEAHIPLSAKLKWLTYMLWGGTVLLLFEHVWHGEIVPWFPFLTAMSSPADAAAMFYEIATVGVCMALLITAVWLVVCRAADAIVKRSAESSTQHTAA